VYLRLSFYKKLATAKNVDQIDRLLEEKPWRPAAVDVGRRRPRLSA
jgi:hypothetical protein